MHCTNCGKELQDDWVKCPYCDTKIIKNEKEDSLKKENQQVEEEKKNKEKIERENSYEKKSAPPLNYKMNINVENTEKKSVKNILKKIITIIGFVFIGFILLVGFWTSSGMGTQKDSIIEVIEFEGFVIALFLIPFLLIVNFKGIRNKLPLYRRKKVGSTILAVFVTCFILALVIVGISSLSLLHTQQYNDEVTEAQRLEEAAAKKKAEEEAAEAEKKAEEEAATKKNAEEEAATKKKAEEEAEAQKAAKAPYLSMDYQEYYMKSNGIDMLFSDQRKLVKEYLDTFDINKCEKVELVSEGFFNIKQYFKRTRNSSEYVYYGGMVDNKPNGPGIIKRRMKVDVYEDGTASVNPANGFDNDEDCFWFTVYVGNFEDGMLNGYGMQFATPLDEMYASEGYDLGVLYQNIDGDIQKSVSESLNPIIYEGVFVEGKYDGPGIEFNYDYIFTQGRYLEIPEDASEKDKKNWQTFNELANSKSISVYQGEYSEGERNGEFKIYTYGYLSYTGDIIDGEKTGQGIIYYPLSKQVQYEGELRRGVPHGFGTRYNEDGTIEYSGEWEDGDYAG